MADFPGLPLVPLADDRSGAAINPLSGWSLGPAVTSGLVSAAWPASNRAVFVPFRVPVPVTAYKMACGTGTGTTGNFDLGIYDSAGNRIVSTGSTAKTTASSDRIIDITDTVLLPGLYYMAMATDGTTNYIGVGLIANVAAPKQFGMREAASSFALPATVTYATISTAHIPFMSIYLRGE